MIQIKNLHASIEDKEILKGLDLEIKPGEVHAIMGPNGSGKSSLSNIISGHPNYEVTEGSITFEGKDLLDLDPDDRALAGIFLAFQYPVEIPGVKNKDFMRIAYNAKQKHLNKEECDPATFEKLIESKMELMEMSKEMLERSVNHGFSGGEKKTKRNTSACLTRTKTMHFGRNRFWIRYRCASNCSKSS